MPGMRLVALCAALAMTVAPATRALAAGSPGVPGALESMTLSNGLRLVLASDPQAAAVDVAVWYAGGLRLEPERQAGIAHLVERLMSMGASRERQRGIEALGGSSGSFTTGDASCFFETVPASGLGAALEIEADRMRAPTIGATQLDAARGAIALERQQLDQGSPLAVGLRELYRQAYGSHPYHAPVTGEDAGLRSITLKDVEDWSRARISPTSAVLTIVGRFEPSEAIALARVAFEPIKAANVASPPPARLQTQTAERRGNQPGPFPFPLVLAGWAVPGRSDPDLAPLLVLSTALARGDGSRLDADLIKRQRIGVFVESDVEVRRDASLLYVALGVQPGADSAMVERALLGGIAGMAREPLSDYELQCAEKQIENGMLFSWQSARNRAQALGMATLLAGDPADAAHLLERLRAVRPADVQRVAAAQLTADRRNVVWLAPRRDGGGAR